MYNVPSVFIFCSIMQGICPAFLLPNAIAHVSCCYGPSSKHYFLPVRGHCAWRLFACCRLLQPAFSETLVTLVVLGPVLCMPIADCLRLFLGGRSHSTESPRVLKLRCLEAPRWWGLSHRCCHPAPFQLCLDPRPRGRLDGSIYLLHQNHRHPHLYRLRPNREESKPPADSLLRPVH